MAVKWHDDKNNSPETAFQYASFYNTRIILEKNILNDFFDNAIRLH